jgi:isocitrate dehydrogenase
LTDEQKVPDNLAALGVLCKKPEAVVVKTPNISASVPQLVACIDELRAKGYNVPLYPTEPKTKEEHAIVATYGKVLGSAVNPVLREGNSDRRVADAVKIYAQKNPHPLKPWNETAKTHVAHMTEGDFYGNEKSVIMSKDTDVKIEHVSADGQTTVLKESISLKADEVVDATFMSA